MEKNPRQLKFRTNKELLDRLAREAKKNGRSLNSEIIERLEDSFGSRLLRVPVEVIEKMLRRAAE